MPPHDIKKKRKLFTGLRSTFCDAESEGFEPSIQFDPYTHFPGVLLQPLGQLSNYKGANLQDVSLG